MTDKDVCESCISDEEDEKREHEEKLKVIEARKEAFKYSPFWFTVWDLSGTLLSVVFWLLLWLLVAQCECNGCIF